MESAKVKVKRPVIWDKTRDTYKDRNETRNAWKEIFVELRPDFEELEDTEKNSYGKKIMKKWTNVRDAFKKSMKKQKNAFKSGAGASSTKTYIYNEQLKFLNKVLIERQTENSLPLNTRQLDTSDEEQETVANLQETTIPTAAVGNNNITKKVPRKKEKVDHVELEMLKALKETPNRHLYLFKGIIPSLESFDDEEVLEFQTTVLQTISSIKKRKKTIPYSQPTYHSQVNSGQQAIPIHYSHHIDHTQVNSGQQAIPIHYRQHIDHTQVNSNEQPITIPRSQYSSPNITHPYPSTSSALLQSQQTIRSMTRSSQVFPIQPVASTSREQSLREYYQTIDEEASPFSVESQSSQDSQESIDFS